MKAQQQIQHEITGTVIVAEDSRFLRRATELILTKHGFTVFAAEDGEQTLELTRQHQPDAIVLDLMMPKLNGVDVIRTLKTDSKTAAIPIIVLSALAQENDAQLIREGAVAYYEKSKLIPELLVDLIREAIQEKRHHADPSSAALRPASQGTERETLRTSSRNHREYEQQLFEKLLDLNNELMISQKKLAAANEQLKVLAEKDELTGIANRRKIQEEFDRLSSIATRHKKPLAVALLDLDHFKAVNDRFGHATGDRVLKKFAETLSKSFRAEDIVGRWGGEEFLVVLYDCSAEDTEQRLAKIGETFAKQCFGLDFIPTFSAGVACYPENGIADLGELSHTADIALYEAKLRGRNKIMTARNTSIESALSRMSGGDSITQIT